MKLTILVDYSEESMSIYSDIPGLNLDNVNVVDVVSMEENLDFGAQEEIDSKTAGQKLIYKD